MPSGGSISARRRAAGLPRLQRAHPLFIYELLLWLGKRPAGGQSWGRFATKAAAARRATADVTAFGRLFPGGVGG